MFEKTIRILRAKLVEMDLLQYVMEKTYQRYKSELENEIYEVIAILKNMESIRKKEKE